MEILLKTTEETEELAGKIAAKLKVGDVLALYGGLGAGKTTFTTMLVAKLGFSTRVQSPTFVLCRKYTKVHLDPNIEKTDDNIINVVNHIDLYRIVSTQELEELDLDELFTEKNAITIIEWPELAEHLLPEKTIKLTLEYITEASRKAYVQNLH